MMTDDLPILAGKTDQKHCIMTRCILPGPRFILRAIIMAWGITGSAGTLPAQWQPLSGPFNCTITGIVQVDSLIFAGTEQSGLYYSENSGATWKYLAHEQGLFHVKGFSRSDNDLYVIGRSKVYVMALDALIWKDIIEVPGYPRDIAHSGDRLWMLDQNRYLYMLNQQSGSWESVPGMEQKSFSAFHPTDNGLFISNNQSVWHWDATIGQWHMLGYPLASGGISAVYKWEGHLFVGTLQHGLFVIRDGKVDWEHIPLPVPDARVQVVAGDDQYVYAGTVKGFARASDPAEAWEVLDVPFHSNWPATMLASKDLVMVGLHNGGMLMSMDHGEAWMYRNEGFHCADIKDMLIHDNHIFAAVMGGGVIRCDSDGQQCQYWNEGLESYLSYRLAVSSDRLFASSYDHGLFELAANNVWQPVLQDNEILRARNLFGQGDTLWFNQVNSAHIYHYLPVSGQLDSMLTPIISGGTGQGVYVYKDTMFLYSGQYSTDHGETWVLVPKMFGDPFEGYYGTDAHLFAMGQRWLYRLDKENLAWERIYTFPVNGLLDFEGGLLAATYYNGIEYGTAEGNDWFQVNQGLDCFYMENVLIHAGYVYAGARDRGIWRIPVHLMSQMTPLQPTDLIGTTLRSPYPNPSHGAVMIPVTVGAGGDFRIRINDIHGRMVHEVFSGHLDRGDHHFQWMTRQVPPGMYLAVLHSGALQETVWILVP